MTKSFFGRLCSSLPFSSLLLGAAAALSAPEARALTVFDLGDLSLLTQTTVDSVVKTIAVGADHRDYQSASSLGAFPGLDLGVDVTLINLPTEFTDAITLATGQAPGLTFIPLPRLNVHKGLPGGVDLGFTWLGLTADGKSNSILGFSAQWSFFKSSISAPTLAVRGSYSKATLPALFTNTTTLKFDLVASKNMGIIDPYFGAGFISGSGSLDLTSGFGSLPISVTAESKITTGHFFVGLPIKLFFIKITPEYDYSFAGVSTYGLKAGFKF
jgi:hypothetical protein